MTCFVLYLKSRAISAAPAAIVDVKSHTGQILQRNSCSDIEEGRTNGLLVVLQEKLF